MTPEEYYQRFEELRMLREQKARELEAYMQLASHLRGQLRELNYRMARSMWTHGVVLPLQMTYTKAAADLKKAAREVKEGVVSGYDRAVQFLEEVRSRVDGAARWAVERAAEREKHLAEYLEKTRKGVARSFERTKDVVTRAAAEAPERMKKAVSSAFERLASRLQAAAGRCRNVLAGYRDRVKEALENVRDKAASYSAVGGDGVRSAFEEDYRVVMALPEMQPLRSLAFGDGYVVDPSDVMDAVLRDREAARSDSLEAQRFRAAKEYWRTVLYQKALERLTSHLSEEEARTVLDGLISAEAGVRAAAPSIAGEAGLEEKRALVDRLVAARARNGVRASL